MMIFAPAAPLRGVAYTFEIPGLPSQAAQGWQANPTLAVGDVKIRKDGGAQANTTNLPTVLNSGAIVQVVLTATEMTADRVVVEFKDAAGAEWCDATVAFCPGYDFAIRRGTAQAGAAGTITLDASASATDSIYLDETVMIVGGTGAGQARVISAYTGSTKVATVVPNWQTNPDSTSVFVILPTARVDLALWRGSAPNTLTSGRVDSVVGAVTAGAITAAAFAANALDAVWSAATRLLTAGTNIVLAKGVGVTGFNDLSAAEVNAEADTALADYDGPTHAELTAELATADDAVLAAIAGLNNLSQANIRTALGMASANLDTQLSAIAGYIDTEVASIIVAIDALPTNAELATALAAADDAVLAAIAALVIPTANENADALLKRDWTAVSGEASRSVLNALRSLRNRVRVAAGTATVYEEDDTTTAWTAASTTDPGADPIVEIDPT